MILELEDLLDPETKKLLDELLKKIFQSISKKKDVLLSPDALVNESFENFINIMFESLDRVLLLETETEIEKKSCEKIFDILKRSEGDFNQLMTVEAIQEFTNEFPTFQDDEEIKLLHATTTFLARNDINESDERIVTKILVDLVSQNITYSFRNAFRVFLGEHIHPDSSIRSFNHDNIKILSERFIKILKTFNENPRELLENPMDLASEDGTDLDVTMRTKINRCYHQIGYFLSKCSEALYVEALLNGDSTQTSVIQRLRDYLRGMNEKILRFFNSANDNQLERPISFTSFIQEFHFIPQFHFWMISQAGCLDLLRPYHEEEMLNMFIRWNLGSILSRIIKTYTDHLQLLGTTIIILRKRCSQEIINERGRQNATKVILRHIKDNANEFLAFSKKLPRCFNQIIDESIRSDLLKKVTWYLLYLKVVGLKVMKIQEGSNAFDRDIARVNDVLDEIIITLKQFFKDVSQKGLYVVERKHAYAALAACSILARDQSILKTLSIIDNFHFLNLYYTDEFLPKFLIGLITINVARKVLEPED